MTEFEKCDRNVLERNDNQLKCDFMCDIRKFTGKFNGNLSMYGGQCIAKTYTKAT